MAGTPKSQWEYIYQTVPVTEIPWENGMPSPDLEFLCEKEVITSGTRILDAGCGLGTQTLYMAEVGAKATGIDISETAINKARSKMLESKLTAKFLIGDVCKMPLPNASFDVLYDRGCYHHLTMRQRKLYVKEMARVLRRDSLAHLLVFSGTMGPKEVVDLFLPYFSVINAEESTFFDHTTHQQLAVHLVRFMRL